MTLDFDEFAMEGNRYLKALGNDLGYPEDRARTARVCRAVLNTFRDMLPPFENMRIIRQLPMALKAFYVDGYTLREIRKKVPNMKVFLAVVKKNCGRLASLDFKNDDEVQDATRIVLASLRQYITVGEIEDVIALLPKDVNQFISRAVGGNERYDSFL